MGITKFLISFILVFNFFSVKIFSNNECEFQSNLQSNSNFQINDNSTNYLIEFFNSDDSVKVHYTFMQSTVNGMSIIEFTQLDAQVVDSIQDSVYIGPEISSAYIADTLSGSLVPSNNIVSPLGSYLPIPGINTENPYGGYLPIPFTIGGNNSLIDYDNIGDILIPTLMDPESSGLGVIFIIEEPLEFEIVINSISSLTSGSPGFIIVKENDDIKVESTHSVVFSAGFEFTSESNLDILIE